MKKIALLSLVFLLGLSYSFGQIVSGNCYNFRTYGSGNAYLDYNVAIDATYLYGRTSPSGTNTTVFKVETAPSPNANYYTIKTSDGKYVTYNSVNKKFTASSTFNSPDYQVYSVFLPSSSNPTWVSLVPKLAPTETLQIPTTNGQQAFSGSGWVNTYSSATCPITVTPPITDSFWEASTVGTGNIRAKSTVNGVIIGTGITSAPAGYKLYVEGGVLAEKVRVTPKNSANWADYVFEKGYKLPTLEKIESYINKNGHLEGIPTTKEVKEQGVDLLEMNTKLLEKVEQLTLYVIQQQKEIKILKKRK